MDHVTRFVSRYSSIYGQTNYQCVRQNLKKYALGLNPVYRYSVYNATSPLITSREGKGSLLMASSDLKVIGYIDIVHVPVVIICTNWLYYLTCIKKAFLHAYVVVHRLIYNLHASVNFNC